MPTHYAFPGMLDLDLADTLISKLRRFSLVHEQDTLAVLLLVMFFLGMFVLIAYLVDP